MIDTAAVEATIATHRMTRFGPRIGVAVSGGADSVFLLHALARLGLAANVLHVNHQLRGAESDQDEMFVRDLAADLDLPIQVARLAPGEGNMEQEARRLRYGFFSLALAQQTCDAIATGHSLDDQAETVLARLLRGSGTSGLKGILPVTEQRTIRPLLALRRDAIRHQLRQNGIAWREDRSNADPDFLRNHIRLDLMPRLADLNPAVAEVLASTAELARDEEEYWESIVAALAERHFAPPPFSSKPGAILLRTGPFLEEPVAAQRRLLRHAFQNVRGDLRRIDFSHVEAVRSLMASREGSGRIQLPGLDIFRSFDWLRIDTPGWAGTLDRNFETDLPVPGTAILPERGLALQIELLGHETVYNGRLNALDGDRIAAQLSVRNWQPGDAYIPDGHSDHVKLKSLFQEGRVPLWERRTWPVVVQGETIVWTRRFGTARQFAVTPETRRALIVRELTESKHLDSASIGSETP
jgi:tRNA(Ile)-lysidine synthase